MCVYMNVYNRKHLVAVGALLSPKSLLSICYANCSLLLFHSFTTGFYAKQTAVVVVNILLKKYTIFYDWFRFFI